MTVKTFDLGVAVRSSDDPGTHLLVDLDKLILTRLLVQANSGGGKSWLLRRLLEQTHGRVQQIVIDPEDEFHTLREKHDYLIGGRAGADCQLSVQSAPLLARRLLETRMSAVLGLFELPWMERIQFVSAFCEAMVDAPKDLWHPVLVVIDEAHIFCPEGAAKARRTGFQKARDRDESDCARSVIDLSTRGRKRGFCVAFATQRISKLDKDAAAECNNKLIGRTSQDNDQKRAADELGFAGKDERRALRRLEPGCFYAFGPAISDEVIEVKVGGVKTSHPESGASATAPPPPSSTVKKLLAKEFADLPTEAIEEAKTVADLQKRIRDLESQVKRAAKAPPAPAVDLEALKHERTEGYAAGIEAFKRASAGAMSKLVATVHDAFDEAERDIRAVIPGMPQLVTNPKPNGKRHPREVAQVTHFPQGQIGRRDVRGRPSEARVRALADRHSHDNARTNGSGELDGPEQRILNALAWLEAIGVSDPLNVAVAFMAGYRPNGGAYNNPKARLRSRGLLEYAGKSLRLTEAGRALTDLPEIPMTDDGLQEAVLARLDGPERRILTPLLPLGSEGMSAAELAEAAGYGAGGGAFNNPKGRLRSLGLIDYPRPGHVCATSVLYPEST